MWVYKLSGQTSTQQNNFWYCYHVHLGCQDPRRFNYRLRHYEA